MPEDSLNCLSAETSVVTLGRFAFTASGLQNGLNCLSAETSVVTLVDGVKYNLTLSVSQLPFG